MNEAAALLLSISSLLRGLPVTLTQQTALWDLYEAYLFGLAIAAARAEGAAVRYEDSDGLPATHLLLRSGPGRIYRPSATGDRYTHGVLQFAGKPALEVHTGIYIVGRSQVPHESDVAVIGRAESVRCRQLGADPRSSTLLLSMEAKFYGQYLSIDLARSFVGLIADFGRVDRYFVSNIGSTRVARFLTARIGRAQWEQDVMPGTDKEAQLRAAIRTSFRNYKAR